MKTMVVGASKGLGRALIEGLGEHGDTLIGVSRGRPENLEGKAGVDLRWVEADLSAPAKAAQIIKDAVVEGGLDTLIYNLGIWEEFAFDPAYNFMADQDDQVEAIVSCNITSTIVLIKRLLPLLLESKTRGSY